MAVGRVLVIEDDPEAASVLVEMLTALGYAPQAAETGPAALRLLPKFQPDIILLDLSLPEAPGDTLLDRLLHSRPDVPVIVIAGGPEELRRRVLSRGAFDYITRPFNLARLTRVLQAALEDRA
jgi:two-component system, OmpR family, KDP operon response regulator KdpE